MSRGMNYEILVVFRCTGKQSQWGGNFPLGANRARGVWYLLLHLCFSSTSASPPPLLLLHLYFSSPSTSPPPLLLLHLYFSSTSTSPPPLLLLHLYFSST